MLSKRDYFAVIIFHTLKMKSCGDKFRKHNEKKEDTFTNVKKCEM